MDLVFAVDGVLRTEEAGGLVDVIRGVSEDSIIGSIADFVIGSVISSLGRELSLLHYLSCSLVDNWSGVTGTMVYMPLISLPCRVQEDGEVVKHCLSRNIAI